MVQQIRKAAVLGAGVMGSGIAAHLANIGIPTILLDIVPHELTEKEKAKGLTLEDKQVRNRISEVALQKLLKQKPAPLTVKENLSFLECGNFTDDMPRLKEVDWVIEVVVENIAVKRRCLKRLIIIGSRAVLSVQIHQVFPLKRWQKGGQKTFKSIFSVLIFLIRHAI